MHPKIAQFFATLAGKALIAAIVILGVIWLVSALTSGQKAKTEAKVAKNQNEAILDSVDVAKEVAAEAERNADEITDETRELVNEVLAAPPGNSNAAALRAVCGMRAYQRRAECSGLRTADPAEPD